MRPTGITIAMRCHCAHELIATAAQTLFKKQANSGAGQPKRMTLEAGSMTFHYIISGNVCYLAIADQASTVAKSCTCWCDLDSVMGILRLPCDCLHAIDAFAGCIANGEVGECTARGCRVTPKG